MGEEPTSSPSANTDREPSLSWLRSRSSGSTGAREMSLPLELAVSRGRQTGQITKLGSRLEDGKCYLRKRGAGI